MKLFDPVQKKEVEVVTKTFELKMKPGTAGTADDPHRPLLADSLENKAYKWGVNEAENTITVSAQAQEIANIAKTHKEAI